MTKFTPRNQTFVYFFRWISHQLHNEKEEAVSVNYLYYTSVHVPAGIVHHLKLFIQLSIHSSLSKQ